MQAKIHPKYVDCAVTCGCGNTFKTRATREKINIEICAVCHPFYSGKQKFVDTAGRVEKFAKRFKWEEGVTASSTAETDTRAKRQKKAAKEVKVKAVSAELAKEDLERRAAARKERGGPGGPGGPGRGPGGPGRGPGGPRGGSAPKDGAAPAAPAAGEAPAKPPETPAGGA